MALGEPAGCGAACSTAGAAGALGTVLAMAVLGCRHGDRQDYNRPPAGAPPRGRLYRQGYNRPPASTLRHSVVAAPQKRATQSWQRLRSAGTCVSKTIVVKKHPKHTGKKRELNSERTNVPRELTRCTCSSCHKATTAVLHALDWGELLVNAQLRLNLERSVPPLERIDSSARTGTRNAISVKALTVLRQRAVATAGCSKMLICTLLAHGQCAAMTVHASVSVAGRRKLGSKASSLGARTRWSGVVEVHTPLHVAARV